MLGLSVVFLYLSVIIIYGNENPKVTVSNGILEGKIVKSKEGREINAFQGIPFAEPPLGKLRFKSPVPKKPWNGVLDASRPHVVCPQIDPDKRTGLFEGNEDCLFLNVYSPKLPSERNEPLPVMVYFHGGAFAFGSGNSDYYGPEVLLDKDIVLVVTNYRIGVLGFLSTGDETSPGNYGMKDQSLALQWVKNNIKYFGGDADKITIFGNSAGGASTHLHMISPLSKGLFHKVISQSGSAFCLWAVTPDSSESINHSREIAEKLGCKTSTSMELVDCLRNIDPAVLVQQEMIYLTGDRYAKAPFRPVIEPPSPDAFLTDTPANLLKEGKFQDVPWLVGMNRDEGLIKSSVYVSNAELFEDLNTDFNTKMAFDLYYNGIAENPDSISRQIRKFYFGEEKKLTVENSFSNLTKMFGDICFSKGLDDAIRIHLKVSKKPVFNYLFAHESGDSYSQLSGSPEKPLGVSHADELLYLFPVANRLFPNRQETEDDRKITRIITTMWENFARTGNPTPSTDEIITKKWEPVKSDKIEYYYIDAKVQETRQAKFKERVEFCRSLPLQLRSQNKKEEL